MSLRDLWIAFQRGMEDAERDIALGGMALWYEGLAKRVGVIKDALRSIDTEDVRDVLIEQLLRPRWVVNEVGDLGLRVGGINFWYYKWSEPIVGKYEAWREMGKREFGESITSTCSQEYWPKAKS